MLAARNYACIIETAAGTCSSEAISWHLPSHLQVGQPLSSFWYLLHQFEHVGTAQVVVDTAGVVGSEVNNQKRKQTKYCVSISLNMGIKCQELLRKLI